MNDTFFFLFIDEIYNPNLNIILKTDREQIKVVKNHHHFGLSGVIIPTNQLSTHNFKCRSIQEVNYPTKENPILHYVDILSSSGLYSDLNVKPEKRKKLIKLIKRWLITTNYRLVFSFIDIENLALKYGIFNKGKLEKISKIKGMFGSYNAKDYNLYYLTLRFMMGQFYEFLQRKKARGVIVAETRGKKEDTELRNAFNSIIKGGYGKNKPKEIRAIIPDIYLIYKHQNHAGLQIADLVLYPTYDAVVPNHNPRTDHIINFEEVIKKKLYKPESVLIFP